MGGSQCYCCGLDPYPSKISEFTLICHCKFSNIIYKCITTISANKLKPSLNEVIGKISTYLYPGRNITEKSVTNAGNSEELS